MVEPRFKQFWRFALWLVVMIWAGAAFWSAPVSASTPFAAAIDSRQESEAVPLQPRAPDLHYDMCQNSCAPSAIPASETITFAEGVMVCPVRPDLPLRAYSPETPDPPPRLSTPIELLSPTR